MMKSKVCLFCGKKLDSSRKEYCSNNCRNKYRYHNNINKRRDKMLLNKKLKQIALKERTKFLISLPPEELLREVRNN